MGRPDHVIKGARPKLNVQNIYLANRYKKCKPKLIWFKVINSKFSGNLGRGIKNSFNFSLFLKIFYFICCIKFTFLGYIVLKFHLKEMLILENFIHFIFFKYTNSKVFICGSCLQVKKCGRLMVLVLLLIHTASILYNFGSLFALEKRYSNACTQYYYASFTHMLFYYTSSDNMGSFIFKFTLFHDSNSLKDFSLNLQGAMKTGCCNWSRQ